MARIIEVIPTRRIAPELTPPIDSVLDDKTVSKIYSSWDPKRYGEPIDYGGNVKAITVNMVYDAGYDFLVSIRGIGEARAARIMLALEDIMAELPYR